MARLPVLKPREITRVLEKMGFVEVRQRAARINNTATQTDAARLFHFRAAAMSHLFC
ncbi:MAG TPA: hypothetical protein VJ248_10350 [Candidatus Udaeobacter sp.]|jgi:hypothetical protein|nr:hypothetical protein [Candidatus Udaeobacter sp.]